MLEFTRSTSQVRVMSQVRVRLKKICFLFLNLILISFDCDYCFHNVALTAAQNINSPRKIRNVLIMACKLFIVKASEESLSLASLLTVVAQDRQNTSKTVEIILPRNLKTRRKLRFVYVSR